MRLSSGQNNGLLTLPYEQGTALSPVSYEIEYGLIHFDRGNGTTKTTTNNSLLVDGLSRNTDYDFYVRAKCETSTFGSWTGPKSFRTN